MTTTVHNTRTFTALTDAQIEAAQAIVDAHNAKVNPTGEPWCAKDRPGYYIIDLTGRKHCFYTLYRYYNQSVRQDKAFQYICNLSLDLMEAVNKVCTHRGLPVMLDTGSGNFRPEHIEALVFHVGRYKGQPISDVYAENPGYVVWAANNMTAKNKNQQMTVEALRHMRDAHFQMVTEENKATCTSRYQGLLKERSVRQLTVYAVKQPSIDPISGIVGKRRYRAQDAQGNLYQFYTNDDLVVNQVYSVTGTVRNHKELLGKQYTCLNRVKVQQA